MFNTFIGTKFNVFEDFENFDLWGLVLTKAQGCDITKLIFQVMHQEIWHGTKLKVVSTPNKATLIVSFHAQGVPFMFMNHHLHADNDGKNKSGQRTKDAY